MSARSRALVFDFDGTILDTETPVYESWRAVFVEAGVEPIPLSTWLKTIGQSDDSTLDPLAILREQLGRDVDADLVVETRRSVRDQILADQTIRDGVVDWIEAAEAQGIALGVASSSSSSWVRPHLERLGLARHFSVVSCADPGTPGKPDPTVYRQACEQLGVETAASLAIEDSTHGVTAAISAGMRCLAVPGPITLTADFSHATASATSLAELLPHDWL